MEKKFSSKKKTKPKNKEKDIQNIVPKKTEEQLPTPGKATQRTSGGKLEMPTTIKYTFYSEEGKPQTFGEFPDVFQDFTDGEKFVALKYLSGAELTDKENELLESVKEKLGAKGAGDPLAEGSPIRQQIIKALKNKPVFVLTGKTLWYFSTDAYFSITFTGTSKGIRRGITKGWVNRFTIGMKAALQAMEGIVYSGDVENAKVIQDKLSAIFGIFGVPLKYEGMYVDKKGDRRLYLSLGFTPAVKTPVKIEEIRLETKEKAKNLLGGEEYYLNNLYLDAIWFFKPEHGLRLSIRDIRYNGLRLDNLGSSELKDLGENLRLSLGYVGERIPTGLDSLKAYVAAGVGYLFRYNRKEWWKGFDMSASFQVKSDIGLFAGIGGILSLGDRASLQGSIGYQSNKFELGVSGAWDPMNNNFGVNLFFKISW